MRVMLGRQMVIQGNLRRSNFVLHEYISKCILIQCIFLDEEICGDIVKFFNISL